MGPVAAEGTGWDHGGTMGTHGAMGTHGDAWRANEGPMGPMGPPGAWRHGGMEAHGAHGAT